MLYPLKEYRITQVFGVNKSVYAQFGLKGHNGIDFAGLKPGDKVPCFATVDCTVVRIGFDVKGFGNFVRVQNDKYEITYAHLDSIAVDLGKVLKAGDPIGIIGTTGFSTGVHLHYQVRELKDGRVINTGNGFKGAIDPMPLFTKTESTPTWQENARKWAIDNKVSNGERPNDTLTRVELWETLRKFSNL